MMQCVCAKTLAILAAAAGIALTAGASQKAQAMHATPVQFLEQLSATKDVLRETLLDDAASVSPEMHDRVQSFYAARDFQPAWTGSQTAEDMAIQAIAALAQADRQGLHDADYALTPSQLAAPPLPGAEAAQLEIALTGKLLRYAQDVRTGRVQPASIYRDAALPPPDFDAGETLNQAMKTGSLKAFFASLPPARPEYRQLVTALAIYRAIAANGGWPAVRNGQSDSLAKRLAAEDPLLAGDPQPSKKALRNAVKRFQARNGLKADGNVTPATLALLNVSIATRIGQIAANMERWRWLPPVFEARYIAVNVPDESLEFIWDGDLALHSRVIVGNKTSPTPILRATVEAVVTNPPWDIPDDIAAKQILPRLRRNPDYLATRHMVLVDGPAEDPQGEKINWRKVQPAKLPYQIQQMPGPDSALGLLMLDMPNDFDVYLHDTPAKKLFTQDDREISNGCIRVQQIFALSTLLLAVDNDERMNNLTEIIADGTSQHIALTKPMPVYLLYWTAMADADGNAGFRPDRYNRDPRLIAALGFDGATAPVRHAKKQKSA